MTTTDLLRSVAVAALLAALAAFGAIDVSTMIVSGLAYGTQVRA